MIAHLSVLLLATIIGILLPNGKTIRAEVAANEVDRAKGLMERKSLEPRTGMIFLFTKEGPHQFWMKNTRIPLDILWLDRDKRVIYINANTPPCPVMMQNCPTYGPKMSALYVLEIEAGGARKNGIQQGMTLSFTIPKEVTVR